MAAATVEVATAVVAAAMEAAAGTYQLEIRYCSAGYNEWFAHPILILLSTATVVAVAVMIKEDTMTGE
jgi:uncharacterized membrane protein